MKTASIIQNRRERRKQERKSKKKRNRPVAGEEEQAAPLNTSGFTDDPTPVKKNRREKVPKVGTKNKPKAADPYAHLDPEVAAALRGEDEEIAELEEKLGLANTKEKNRLHNEYAKLEGYGDDFGDFLDDLDTMVLRVTGGGVGVEGDDSGYLDSTLELEGDEDSSGPDEEIVPMKESLMLHEDESTVSKEDVQKIGDDGNNLGGDDDYYCEFDSPSEKADDSNEPDHDIVDTYQPSRGEDIYGRTIDNQTGSSCKPSKYFPPHLRETEDIEDRREKLRMLTRNVNNALNRLSEDTLISVAQTLTQLYKSYSVSDANDALWSNVTSAVIERPILMATMIPVYIACLAGTHLQTEDTVQLGGFLMEKIVTKLWKVRSTSNEISQEQGEGKVASNLTLCLSYLYNFGVTHASFMFDLVRDFIKSFTEMDIELILLILSHSGHLLRSDDPLALKEIVLSVQRKKAENDVEQLSSRFEYMICAMNDLKNNKRRKQDATHSETTSKLRKLLGRIKSDASTRSSDSCLRIGLQDILDVDSQGRWWKVGASWVGNQYIYRSDRCHDKDVQEGSKVSNRTGLEEGDDELMKVACKYRMNTDARRSIFCIIIKGADCDDAFEKLVRGGMLKNRTERDCVRVLLECCGNETNYNPYYSHLASRICDYQHQCRFSFQLAFWDLFKQWESVSHRKAANLAKLLCHLVAVHRSLRVSVLKPLDTSNLEETALIFLTVLFSTMFELLDDPLQVFDLFEKKKASNKLGEEDNKDGLQENLLVFFMQTLKLSPKNKKGSRFRANLKAAIKACEDM